MGTWAGRENLVGDRQSSVNGAITLTLKLIPGVLILKTPDFFLTMFVLYANLIHDNKDVGQFFPYNSSNMSEISQICLGYVSNVSWMCLTSASIQPKVCQLYSVALRQPLFPGNGRPAAHL